MADCGHSLTWHHSDGDLWIAHAPPWRFDLGMLPPFGYITRYQITLFCWNGHQMHALHHYCDTQAEADAFVAQTKEDPWTWLTSTVL